MGGLVQSTFCGDATVPVDALLSGARTISPGLMQTQPQPIPLHKRGENTGQILGNHDGNGCSSGNRRFIFKVEMFLFSVSWSQSHLPISCGPNSVKDCGANPYSSARKSASSPKSVHLRRRETLCDSSAEIGCFWWHSAFLQLAAGIC